MTWPQTIIVTLGGMVAAGFFLGAAWLRWTPRATDGCWLKKPGFNHQKRQQKPRHPKKQRKNAK